MNVIKLQNLLDIFINVGFGVAYAITLLYGSNLVINGTITIGDLVAFNGYLGILSMPVNWLPWVLTKYKKSKVSLKRLEELVNLPLTL